jgi:hypothetical protein
MSQRRRTLAFVSVAVVALVSAAVVYGASGTSGVGRVDPLVLNGRAPHSVELRVSLSTGASFTTSGTVAIDTSANALGARLLVPVLTADTEVDVRATGGHVYLTSPNLADASGPVWYTLATRWPSFAGLSKFLLRPNSSTLTLLANASIAHAGYVTTYEFNRSNVALGSLTSSHSPSNLKGTLEIRLTTGAQGEFTSLRVVIISASATTTVQLDVVSYNHSVSIAPPPLARARASASPLISQILSSGALGSLFVPTQLLTLIRGAKVS